MSNSVAIALESAPEHRLRGHPESPDRFARLPTLVYSGIGSRLEVLTVDPARVEQLAHVHPDRYLQQLQAATESAPAFLDGGDTYVCSGSYRAALRAAEAAVTVTERVLAGGQSCGFSLGRPPGHHASAERALGFCLLNNVAIAARAALDAGVDRLMIFDFDVHHGNGTQDLFAAEPRVAYVSFHQRGIFPGTGYIHERGVDAGEGSILNVPLPAGTGHTGYVNLFRKVALSASAKFRPDLLLVSAGFDAHWRDPLATLQLIGDSYHELGRIMAEAASAADCSIVYVLEGGYDADVLYLGVISTIAGTLGLPAPSDSIGQPPTSAEQDVSGIWDSLQGHPML